MNTNQKFLSGIIIGVAVGAAVLFLTKTRKGKEILDDVSDATDDARETLLDKLSSFEKQFKEVLKKGKAFIDDIEDKAKNFTS